MQNSRNIARLVASLLINAALAVVSASSTLAAVEQWGTYEVVLDGPQSGNPYLSNRLSARFTKAGESVSVPGFYEGNGIYKVRFMPPSAGEWRYETASDVPELNGRAGTCTATKPSGNNHGPVRVSSTFYLRYADGAEYHQFGTTCYAWVHQPRELQEQTLRTLASSPFNKIRFCVFPKSYSYNKNEPERFAFKQQADGRFDFDQPDPVFWQKFEQRILDLQKLGIEADIILWHPYDRWGFASMNDEQDDRYLRYCIARLGAYRNVWWSLANEFDFMTDQPRAGHKGNKQWADWDRFFSILEKEDPYGRLRGIHNGSKWYDHTRAWVTHASLQTSDMNGGVRYRAQYRKPVLYDECKYEGDIRQGWGQLSAREMTQRFWLGTLSGCYVGHGETYAHPEDILWWAKGGVLHGQSPQRIQWLKDFMAKSPSFEELKPLGNDQGRFLLAQPGEYYLLYALDERTQSIELSGDRPYKVDAIDPWEMREWPASTARPGTFHIAAPRSDLVYRFVPYLPGETLRPEARATASVMEGTPPLTVKFSSTSTDSVRWDFGDGETSTAAFPTHTFSKPGLYTVTLTVTNQEGKRAENHLQIAVDRNSSDPILRAAVATGESPALRLQGTATRQSDGALRLPPGEPWGWADAGPGVIEDLRGLRSFTISGWLKPESLETGSGGNRIVFCLNRDRAGIDLVSRADGRLRLAVNQWADLARDATSKTALVAGKWTFFAVTYDAARDRDNLCWYLSTPQDSPGSEAMVTLDRKGTYNVGPVARDVGPLAVGNFNEMMRGYGLDRQFRGLIRNLRISGSRLAGRGALDLEAIRQRM